ncbi:hypothetical protein B0H19DRAFT_681668 [Mycena capillaripes]|nr:hypothetical protein B0H19DRAFT_681668 [Mycena capillaripes]
MRSHAELAAARRGRRGRVTQRTGLRLSTLARRGMYAKIQTLYLKISRSCLASDDGCASYPGALSAPSAIGDTPPGRVHGPRVSLPRHLSAASVGFLLARCKDVHRTWVTALLRSFIPPKTVRARVSPPRPPRGASLHSCPSGSAPRVLPSLLPRYPTLRGSPCDAQPLGEPQLRVGDSGKQTKLPFHDSKFDFLAPAGVCPSDRGRRRAAAPSPHLRAARSGPPCLHKCPHQAPDSVSSPRNRVARTVDPGIFVAISPALPSRNQSVWNGFGGLTRLDEACIDRESFPSPAAGPCSCSSLRDLFARYSDLRDAMRSLRATDRKFASPQWTLKSPPGDAHLAFGSNAHFQKCL